MSKQKPPRTNPTGVFLESAGKDDVAGGLATISSINDFNAVQITTLPKAYYTAAGAQKLNALLERYSLEATSVCMIFEGESYADMEAVANTVGYRPEETLDERLEHSWSCIDLAAALGSPVVTTHMGVLPQDENDPIYKRLLKAVGMVAEYGETKGVQLSLETGQETSEELLKFLEKLDDYNIGINFDPANLVLYGMDSPAESLKKVYDRVTSVHMKDGLPPEKEGQLGAETRLGEGQAQLVECIDILQERGFQGPLIIENFVWAANGTDPLDEMKLAAQLLENHWPA